MQTFLIQTSLGEMIGLIVYYLWNYTLYIFNKNDHSSLLLCVIALTMRELLRRRAVKVLCLSCTTEAGDIHLPRKGRGGVYARAEGMTL